MLLRVKLVSGHEEVVQFNRIGRFTLTTEGTVLESDLEYLIGTGFGQRACFNNFKLKGFTKRCNNIIKHIPLDSIFSIYSLDTNRACSVSDLRNN